MREETAQILRRVRVVHLNTAKTWRGGEQQVLYLADQIQAAGGAQMIVGQPGSEMEKRAEARGIPFHPLKMRGELDFIAAHALRKFCREFKADILHAHTAKAHALGLLARRKLPDTRFVVTRRVDFHRKPNFLSRWKYLSPFVDRFIAISDNVKRILIQDGIPPEKIRIAYSGIDTRRFANLPDDAPLRREFQIPEGVMIFGNVAALVDHKDQRTLLHAAAILKKELPPGSFCLFISGEGELRSELEELAGSLGLSDGTVIFTGFRTDILAFLRLFDVFVMSSKEEGLGTAVLDAMASGLPVAATDAGGLPEMIDQGQGGLLSAARNPEALAVSMKTLFTDQALRARFGAYNQKRVQRFSAEATFEDTVAVYGELVGGS